MNVSGIAVTTKPEYVELLSGKINALKWAEVHTTDDMGRMIVVMEGEDTDQEISRLQELKSLPKVIFAEMVLHYIEENTCLDEKESHERALQKLNDNGAHSQVKSYYQSLKQINDR